MARTQIAPAVLSPEGAAPVVPESSDPVNGNEMPNTTGLSVKVTNSGAADATITFVTQATVGGYAVEDVTVTVPVGTSLVFGHFPPGVFGTSLQFDTDAAMDVEAYR